MVKFIVKTYVFEEGVKTHSSSKTQTNIVFEKYTAWIASGSARLGSVFHFSARIGSVGLSSARLGSARPGPVRLARFGLGVGLARPSFGLAGLTQLACHIIVSTLSKNKYVKFADTYT